MNMILKQYGFQQHISHLYKKNFFSCRENTYFLVGKCEGNTPKAALK